MVRKSAKRARKARAVPARRAGPRRTEAKAHQRPAKFTPAWKLEDAKARFSEVVRRAQAEGPQYVTVRGPLWPLSTQVSLSVFCPRGSHIFRSCLSWKVCMSKDSI